MMPVRAIQSCMASALLVCGAANAGPQADVQKLFDKASHETQSPIRFSDGSSKWIDGSVVYKLASGRAVIVKATHLALDTDGASPEIRKCDSSAQAGTALPGAHGEPIDSNATPYIVLPRCDDSANKAICEKSPPYRQLGLQKGDLAAVIVGDKIAYAIAGDVGPEKKFGEGSIELHRRLGHEVIGAVKDKPTCAANVSLSQDTYLVVFPKSNDKWLANSNIEDAGMSLWNALLAAEAK